MQGTTDGPYRIVDALLPEADPVCDDATALDPAMGLVDPQLTLMELLVRHVRLPCELLPQIEINSCVLACRLGLTFLPFRTWPDVSISGALLPALASSDIFVSSRMWLAPTR